jgi:hypothetical protein
MEEEAEKILVGFDSKKGFIEMDKNGNMADGIRVEVMELKPVIIKKATEERTRGEVWQNQPEVYRLKHASPLQRAPTYFKRYIPLVYRVASR